VGKSGDNRFNIEENHTAGDLSPPTIEDYNSPNLATRKFITCQQFHKKHISTRKRSKPMSNNWTMRDSMRASTSSNVMGRRKIRQS
jgi:hypothetical protein